MKLNLGEENDVVIYYGKEGETSEEKFEYDAAKIFSPVGQERSFTESCPKELRKDKPGATRCRKKCTEKRLQLGSDVNVSYFFNVDDFSSSKFLVGDFL